MLANEFLIDKYNDRVKCFIFDWVEGAKKKITNMEISSGVGKSIVYTLKKHKNYFEKQGYEYEGKITGYFLGEDAYLLSKFLKVTRKLSTGNNREKILAIAKKDEKKLVDLKIDSEKYHIIPLIDPKYITQLSQLYKKVFKYYPVDIFNPNYIAEKMKDNALYVIALHNEKIVAAGSAIIDWKYGCAEISDCVTDPDFRGNNLMAHVITKIEEQLFSKQIRTLYSLTRTESFGMNINISRLGYEYEGTLINNCKIYSGFEDMNIWTKIIS